jgi:glycosyltransferase involved in cell wall biosynthesis
MDQAPLISFIIPVYDVPADILCECINSIMALSLRAYEREIIVVDDGS